jgi:hypothetical protein
MVAFRSRVPDGKCGQPFVRLLSLNPMNPTYKRVCHFHIRKTAGTSLNAAFWALGGPSVGEIISSARKAETGGVIEGNGLKFVRGDPGLIRDGDYFFAATHSPAFDVEVPPDTFTITILRDPVARVVSYYNYLLWARTDPNAGDHEPYVESVIEESRFIDGGLKYSLAQLTPRRLRTESEIQTLGARQFLRRLIPVRGNEFERFLAGVPPRRLLNQLYTFSRRMDPQEAANRILECSAVCFTETFLDDLERLAATLELDLELKHERRFGDKVELEQRQLDLLHERLTPEYEMIERVRQCLEPETTLDNR